MDWLQFLEQIFKTCIIPLLGLLTSYLVLYLRNKAQNLCEKVKDETLQKHINLTLQIVANCVIATNQTYVETLKKEGRFDLEAQKVAFQKTYDAVLCLLTQETQNQLTIAFGDLQVYLTNLIEAQINMAK